MIVSLKQSGGASLGAIALALAAPEAAAAATLADIAAPAAPTESDAPSDIVVIGSANKRTVADQGATVTDLNATALRNLGLNKLNEITAFAPGLFQPQAAITPSHITIFIRGIGELDQQGRPSIGTYVDDVFIPRTTGSNVDLLDVEKVAVARGPQGFTFGHSAEGGTIGIRTKTPGNDLEGRAEMGYGSYNEFKVAGAASGPIVRDLAYFSIAAQHRQRDGVTHNATTGRDNNNLDATTFRAKLLLTPGDRLTITTTVDGTFDYGDARLWSDLNRSRDPDIAFTNIDTRNKYEQIGVSGAIDYRLSDSFALRSITAYRRFINNSDFDNNGDLYARGIGLLKYKENFASEEVRLTGQIGRFALVTGVYLSRENWSREGTNNGSSTLTVDPNLSVFQPIFGRSIQRSDNFALFGQASWAVTDRLSLIGGLRWNVNREHSNIGNWSLGPTAGHSVIGYIADRALLEANRSLDLSKVTRNWAIDVGQSWSKVTPKLAIEYKWSPALLTYASYSQGRKDGGFDYRGIAPTNAARLQNALPYNPELLTTYEVGFRANLANHWIMLNGAVFYNDFDDIQLTTLDPSTQISRRFSAGDGHIGGAELEANIQPVPDLNFSLSGGYLDARLDRFNGVPGNVTYPNGVTLHTTPFSGARLPNAPEFQGQVSAYYRLPLPGDTAWRIGGNAQYRSTSFVDSNNNAINRIPAQTLVNLTASVTSANERWSLRVDARNIFNKRYSQWKSYTQSGSSVLYFGTFYNDPRTVFVTASYKL